MGPIRIVAFDKHTGETHFLNLFAVKLLDTMPTQLQHTGPQQHEFAPAIRPTHCSPNNPASASSAHFRISRLFCRYTGNATRAHNPNSIAMRRHKPPMTEIQQLQQQVRRLERRMAIVYSAFAVLAIAGLLTATMGMAGNVQPGQSITTSRIGIVDNAGREVMSIGASTDGTAGMWLKRGNSSNPIMIQQADNTAYFWGHNFRIEANADTEVAQIGTTNDGRAGIWFNRGSNSNPIIVQQADNTAYFWGHSYKLESSANNEVAQLGTSTEGRAGIWFMQGNRSNNVILQTADNNMTLWAHDYYVKDDNRIMLKMGSNGKNAAGVWLYSGNTSKWALSVQP